ncbi:MAG: 3-oxoacyl-ACP synthase III [Myxococcota bacterium]
MRFDRVGIRSVAHVIPPLEVTSAGLEERLTPIYERIGLHAGRLEMMTGIRARRFWPRAVKPSTIAADAGRLALQKAGVSPSALDLLVFCGVCRDQVEPATANAVHHALEAGSECMVFDVSNACLGMLNGMLWAANLIDSGRIGNALVVAGEDGRPLVDLTVQRLLSDPNVTRASLKREIASLTVGSGAAAVLLSENLEGRMPSLMGGVWRSATEHHRLCVGGHESVLSMNTDSEALLEAGLEVASTTFRALQTELDCPNWDVVVTHQVGKAHERRLLDLLGLDPAQAHRTYPNFGNVGSVSLPLTWSDGLDNGVIQGHHHVALLGIGSGINCMMMGISP